MIVFIHNPSFVVNAAATYSALVLQRALDTWRLVLYTIAPLENVKTILDVEREVPRSPAPPNWNPSNQLMVFGANHLSNTGV